MTQNALRFKGENKTLYINLLPLFIYFEDGPYYFNYCPSMQIKEVLGNSKILLSNIYL